MGEILGKFWGAEEDSYYLGQRKGRRFQKSWKNILNSHVQWFDFVRRGAYYPSPVFYGCTGTTAVAAMFIFLKSNNTSKLKTSFLLTSFSPCRTNQNSNVCPLQTVPKRKQSIRASTDLIKPRNKFKHRLEILLAYLSYPPKNSKKRQRMKATQPNHLSTITTKLNQPTPPCPSPPKKNPKTFTNHYPGSFQQKHQKLP